MPLPRIAAVATATPRHRFDQARLVELAGYTDPRRRGFFAQSDIEGRHLWLDPERQLSVALLTNRTWPDRAPANMEKIKEVRPAFHDAIAEALA